MQFSKTEPIKHAWEIVKKHFWFILGVMVATALISYLPSLIINNYLAQSNDSGGVVVGIVYLLISIVQIIMGMGFLKITLLFVDGKKPDFQELFNQYPKFISYLVASILYGLMVFLGFLLLIVPGIYLAVKFQFYSYLIIDKDLGPIEALKESSRMTKGTIMNLFLFDVLVGLIAMAGYLLFIVGIFVTAPLAALATAFVYRKLSKAHAKK